MMVRNALLFSALILIYFVNQVQAQDVALLSPTKMLKLMPKRIKGFQQIIDPKALEMKVGTLTYTLCEENFNDGKRSIKILLFDFKEASIMYNQATRKWNKQSTMEFDSLVERSVMIRNCSGWESFNKHNRTSQLFLGICERFFLTITGENVNLDELRKVLDDFPLEEFPK